MRATHVTPIRLPQESVQMDLTPSELMNVASRFFRQKGLMLVTLGNTLAVLIGALLWFVIARWLTVSEYGELNYMISIGALAANIAVLGLPVTLQTYLPRGEEHLAGGAVAIAGFAGLTLGLMLYMIHPLLPLLTLGTTLFGVAAGERLGRKDYKGYAMLQILSKGTLLAWIVALVPRAGVYAALMGYAVIPLLSSAWLLLQLRNVVPGLKLVRRHLRFSLAALALGLTTVVGLRIDKVLIGYLYGDAALGYYQLAFQFFMALSVIPTSLRAYLLPEKSSGSRTRMAELAGVAVSVLAAAAGIALIPWVVKKFFPNFYPTSARAAQITSVGVIPSSIFSIWSSKLLSEERPVPVLVINALSLAVLAVSICVLGQSMGVTGLAASLVLYRTSAALMGVVSMKAGLDAQG